MKKYILKFNRWLGNIFKVDRQEALYAFIDIGTKTDAEDEKEWLIREWQKQGFHSYINMRHATITKEIFLALERRDFQRCVELDGQRQEIMKLKAQSKKEYEISQLEIKKETVLKETGEFIKKSIKDDEEEFYQL